MKIKPSDPMMKTVQDKMFGCDMEAFVESVETSSTFRFSGPSMVLMSLMSDAQEQIAMGDAEGARQTLNRTKYLVDRYVPSTRKD